MFTDPLNRLSTCSSHELAAEFHFAMDEYWQKLGCPPPIQILVNLPALLAIALLKRAIFLGTPINELEQGTV